MTKPTLESLLRQLREALDEAESLRTRSMELQARAYLYDDIAKGARGLIGLEYPEVKLDPKGNRISTGSYNVDPKVETPSAHKRNYGRWSRMIIDITRVLGTASLTSMHAYAVREKLAPELTEAELLAKMRYALRDTLKVEKPAIREAEARVNGEKAYELLPSQKLI